MESQAVNALKQGLHVGGALLLLLGRGLFDRPLDELFDASPAEVSEGAVGWVNHAVLNMSLVRMLHIKPAGGKRQSPQSITHQNGLQNGHRVLALELLVVGEPVNQLHDQRFKELPGHLQNRSETLNQNG